MPKVTVLAHKDRADIRMFLDTSLFAFTYSYGVYGHNADGSESRYLSLMRIWRVEGTALFDLDLGHSEFHQGSYPIIRTHVICHCARNYFGAYIAKGAWIGMPWHEGIELTFGDDKIKVMRSESWFAVDISTDMKKELNKAQRKSKKPR